MRIFISIIALLGYGAWAGLSKAIEDYEYSYSHNEGVEDFIAR